MEEYLQRSFIIYDFTNYNEEFTKKCNDILTGKNDKFNIVYNSIKDKKCKLDLICKSDLTCKYDILNLCIYINEYQLIFSVFDNINFDLHYKVINYIDDNVKNKIILYNSMYIGIYQLHFKGNSIVYNSSTINVVINSLNEFIDFVYKFTPEYIVSNDIKIALK